MKKFIFSIIVISFSIPASAAVNIVMTTGSGYDYNQVAVSYVCTAGEEVRAFALQISVTDKGFVVGSAMALSTEYYIYPSSISFTVASDGNTYINNLGSPVAQQDPNGGVIEMASLYAAGDVNHPSPPPSSGSLLRFGVDNPQGYCKRVTLSLNTQRGGIVLKDPNVIPTVTLPAQLSIGMCGWCWLCPGQQYGDTN
jgi:hypothetical protein